MDEFLPLAIGFIFGGLVFGVLAERGAIKRAHAELCPTVLEHALTAADSLAVFREHDGCFEFVQKQDQ